MYQLHGYIMGKRHVRTTCRAQELTLDCQVGQVLTLRQSTRNINRLICRLADRSYPIINRYLERDCVPVETLNLVLCTKEQVLNATSNQNILKESSSTDATLPKTSGVCGASGCLSGAMRKTRSGVSFKMKYLAQRTLSIIRESKPA